MNLLDRHIIWYIKLCNHLVDNMNFQLIDQDICVFRCTPLKDKPLIYVGLYADDFVYYSKIDQVQVWFENKLKSYVKVNSWGTFLGFWDNDTTDTLILMVKFWCIFRNRQ